jgi:hypothetical protein
MNKYDLDRLKVVKDKLDKLNSFDMATQPFQILSAIGWLKGYVTTWNDIAIKDSGDNDARI